MCRISLSHSTGIRVLAREAAERNPRLREPLYLYALFTGQIVLLQKSVRVPALAAVYAWLPDDPMEMEKQLQTELSSLPEGYRKVWHSYFLYKDRGKRDEETKELMRRQIIPLQAERDVSNYQLYTSLELDPGNVNAWLKHGDGRKVSLQTARTVLEQARSYR